MFFRQSKLKKTTTTTNGAFMFIDLVLTDEF